MRAFFLTGIFVCAASLAALGAASGAAAQSPVPSVDSRDIAATALTIYPDNLGFVRETRTLDLPKGLVDLRFFGVSDMIIPQSAVLESFEGLRLEGNFDSDLITPRNLLERSVGETVTIRRLNPVTGDADLVSAELVSAAPVQIGRRGINAIFKTTDGVEGYQCSGLAESLILSNLPEGLNSVPVLSTRVMSETAGPKDITLTYMTRGLGWSADYRMDIYNDREEVGLLGWLTLQNKTSKNFEDTDLSVVAGSLNQVTNRNASNQTSSVGRVANCILHKNVIETRKVVRTPASTVQYAPMASYSSGGADDIVVTTGARIAKVREATQENLGDYKLYRAPQAVSVAPYQTKQIAFLAKSDVELKQGNRHKWTLSEIQNYGEENTPIKSRVVYSLDNSKDGNLAVPLPAGQVRAMSKTEDGLNIFMGEDSLPNSAIGLPVELEIAESFLVTADFSSVKLEGRKDGDKISVRINVNNATTEPVTAEFDFDYFKGVKIDHAGKRRSLSNDDKIYTLNVPAESTVTFMVTGYYL
jgi:hypothetical protein